MANKRNLKKNVNCIIGELFTECWVQYNYVAGTNKEEAQALMEKILLTQHDFVTRICHPEPGNVKGYFKKFRADFNEKVNELIEEIGKLN